jgi:hypothetical protein
MAAGAGWPETPRPSRFSRLGSPVPRLAGLTRAGGDGGDAQLMRGRDGAAGAGEGDFYQLGLVRREDLQVGRGRRLAGGGRVVLRVGHAKRRVGLTAGFWGDKGADVWPMPLGHRRPGHPDRSLCLVHRRRRPRE